MCIRDRINLKRQRYRLKLIIVMSLSVHIVTSQDRMCVLYVTNGLHGEDVWTSTGNVTLEKTCIHVLSARDDVHLEQD